MVAALGRLGCMSDGFVHGGHTTFFCCKKCPIDTIQCVARGRCPRQGARGFRVIGPAFQQGPAFLEEGFRPEKLSLYMAHREVHMVVGQVAQGSLSLDEWVVDIELEVGRSCRFRSLGRQSSPGRA